jgi:hypothetical protein
MTARQRAEATLVLALPGFDPKQAPFTLVNTVELAILAAQSDERERCAKAVFDHCPTNKDTGRPCPGCYGAFVHVRALPPEDVKP